MWQTVSYIAHFNSAILRPSGTNVILEPLPGVSGNTGKGAFILGEQGILSNYFQGTRELLIRLLGSREH